MSKFSLLAWSFIGALAVTTLEACGSKNSGTASADAFPTANVQCGTQSCVK